MEERRKNETWWIYALRLLCEKPQVVLAAIGLAAASVMYVDLRELMRSQMEYNTQVAQELRELNVRVVNLEEWHRMDTKQGLKRKRQGNEDNN